MIKKSVASLVASVVAGAGLVVAMPLNAHAAPAPSCVLAQYVSSKKHVFVQNQCRGTVRVKVIWAWGPDSACTTIGGTAANGYAPYRTFKRPVFTARWDGIVSC